VRFPPRVGVALVVGAGIAIAAGLAVLAQPASNQSSSSSSDDSSTAAPPGVPVIKPPPDVIPPTNDAADTDEDTSSTRKAPTNSVKAAAAPPPPVPEGPKPQRSPTAVLQALDKVTAETMRFAVPVGQPVRYKNLVFIVKACETSAVGETFPRSSAYVVIDLAPLPAEGYTPAPPRQVFKGWMFANSPGLNPFQHPIYDAWLITCMATVPPTTSPPPA
jgi:hypothetical protein